MGTKSRETIYGASVRAAAEQAAEARKTADRLAYVVAGRTVKSELRNSRWTQRKNDPQVRSSGLVRPSVFVS
jgi:hypothetical protein